MKINAMSDKDDKRKSENTTIAVSHETRQKIRLLAAMKDRTIKEVVEEMVEAELKK